MKNIFILMMVLFITNCANKETTNTFFRNYNCYFELAPNMTVYLPIKGMKFGKQGSFNEVICDTSSSYCQTLTVTATFNVDATVIVTNITPADPGMTFPFTQRISYYSDILRIIEPNGPGNGDIICN